MITAENLIYDKFGKSSLYIGELKRIFLTTKIFMKRVKLHRKLIKNLFSSVI